MVDKGKKIAVAEDSTGKRKRGRLGDADNSRRKNKKSGVLQFFEDTADVDDDDASDGDASLHDDDQDAQLNAKNELGKVHNLPFIPKEEEIDEEEFEKMMEERFKQGSRFVRYAEDDYETKRMVEKDYHMPSAGDPTVWKVKCMAGRERHSALCLMQKFADLKSLGTKLSIISAFAVEHVKGFIYIEADKQCDVIEACKGLSSIYSSRMAPVLKNDVFYLLTAQSKHNEVSVGMWACVKNGKYKGDLAQIVAVNKEWKRATVKLIPRIDLQALAAKFGGGATIKKSASAAPRLISSSELEEFRPLIQYRRDRDTGLLFENLDGLMFKDGYLYKKVSMDSLSCWGIEPSEEQLLKFAPSENNESADSEWLSQLYGKQRKKQAETVGKGGGKGKGSSSSSSVGFELYELVCFGRKDFGLIVGMEKDDMYKVLHEGSEGATVATVERRNLKNLTSDMKFTAFDHCMKTISVNDTVRVLEGSSKGKQGLVKQIYRGIVFLHDENETENGGYFCSKSRLCEKIKLFVDACNEKGGGSGDPGFEEFPSSPKSPLSPKKQWEAKEFNSDFKRGDKDGIFSVGQTLRIRVGPLKGYLCRVLAIRYSDVTVKLDSQRKVLTVRSEHLAEVRGKSFGMSTSDEPGSNSFKTFDLLGTESGAGDWTNGVGTSTESDKWNAGGLSAETERSSWPSFPAAVKSLQPESSSWNLFGFSDNDPEKDVEDSAWGSKGTAKQNSSWGAAATDGKNDDCWNKAGKKKDADDNQDSWRKLDSWDKGKNIVGNSSWGDATAEKNLQDSWGKGKGAVEAGATVNWEKDKNSVDLNKDGSNGSTSDWNKAVPAAEHPTSSWVNTGGESSWSKQDGGKNSWGKQDGGRSLWGKQDGGSLQGKQDGGSSWGKWDGGSSWGTQDGGGGSLWGKQDGGGSSWGKQDGGSSWGTQDGGGSLGGKQDGGAGSSWGKQNGDAGSSWGKQDAGGSSWGKQDAGGSLWGKQDGGGGGSSWGKQEDGGGGGSSWGRQAGGGSSWGKQDGVGGGSSWGKQDGGGGSSWGKQDGESSWGKQVGCRGFGERWGRGRGRGGRDYSGRGRSFGQGQSSNWKDSSGNNWNSDGLSSGNQSSWKEPNASGENAGSGWKGGWSIAKEICESGGKRDSAKPSSGNWSAQWKKESGSNEEQSGHKDEGKSWDSGNQTSSGDNGTGKGNWNSGCEGDRSQGSGWGQKNNWNTGSSGASENHNWDKKGNWNSVCRDAGENQEWYSGSNVSNRDSSWGKKANWNAGSGGVNQDSSWSKKSDWNSGNEDQNENRTGGGNWRGDSGGRDGYGSRRGSLRGRGRSDRGGYGGRGRSDRGGYGSRGGSGRGCFGGRDGSDTGFGGRGCGRRDQDDWGTKNNDGVGSWNQGGSDNSQGKSWHSGNTEASSQACGWSGHSSGWNQTTGTKDAGGGDNFVGWSQGNNWKSSDTSGGWKKGSDRSAQAGDYGNQGSGSGNASGTSGGWNKGSDGSAQAGGWGNQGPGSGNASGTCGGWNKGSDGSTQAGGRGNQGSGSGNASGNNDQPKSWNHHSNAAGWGQSKDREE